MALETSGLRLIVENEAGFSAALDRASKNATGFGNALLLVANKSGQVTGVIEKAATTIEQSSKKADAATKSLVGTGSVLGVGREQFARLGSSAALAFNAIGAAAGQSESKVGQLIQTASQLGTALAFGGGAGLAVTGISVAVGALVSAFDQQIDKAAEAIIANDQYTASLMRIAGSNKGAVDAVREYARAQAEMAAGGGFWEKVLEGFVKFAPGMQGVSQAVNRGQSAFEAINPILGLFGQHIETDAEKELRLKGAAEAATDAILKQNRAILDNMDIARLYAEDLALIKSNQDALNFIPPASWNVGGTNYFEGPGGRNPRSVNQANTKSNAAWVKIHEDSIKALATAMEGIAAQALQPTEVTPQEEQRTVLQKRQQQIQEQLGGDIGPNKRRILESENADIEKQLKLLGPYVDKWDEADRRFKAIATGTPPTAYGDKFAKNFESLGLSAEDASRKFEDFSLFADKTNIDKFLNMDQVVGNMKDQIAGMAGKANVTKAAVEDFWQSASQEDLANMAAAGITDVQTAFEQMSDPMGFAVNQATALNDQLGKIPPKKETEVNLTKKDVFDKNYAEVKKLIDAIPTELNIKVNIGAGGGGGNTGNYQGGASEQNQLDPGNVVKPNPGQQPPAPSVPPSPPAPPRRIGGEQMASGGFGYLSHKTLFIGDPGEYYWFSGSPLNPAMFRPGILPPQMSYATVGGSNTNFQFDFNGPLSVRQEADLEAIARYVTRSIRGDVMSRRRIGG